MSKNIYVGNLAWSTNSDELLAIFSQHGKVIRAQVVIDRDTGRSRGFGFVEMENEADAQKAIEALNGFEHQNRPLTVNEAKAKEARTPPPPASRSGSTGPRSSFRHFGGTDRGRRY